MPSTRVKLNKRTLQGYLDGERGVRQLLETRAQNVLRAAQADAEGYVKTGNYLAGLAVREDHTDRLVLRVGSNAPHAHLVEAEHGTLARALDAAR